MTDDYRANTVHEDVLLMQCFLETDPVVKRGLQSAADYIAVLEADKIALAAELVTAAADLGVAQKVVAAAREFEKLLDYYSTGHQSYYWVLPRAVNKFRAALNTGRES